jgi:hypothetical protein
MVKIKLERVALQKKIPKIEKLFFFTFYRKLKKLNKKMK